jgi:hypothetical protein
MEDSKFKTQIKVLSVADKGQRREWMDAEKVQIVKESRASFSVLSRASRVMS